MGGPETETEGMIETRERLAPRNEVKSNNHLEICGGLSEGMSTKRYSHGPMDFAKTLKLLRLRVGHLDLPERGTPGGK